MNPTIFGLEAQGFLIGFLHYHRGCSIIKGDQEGL